MTPDGTDPAGVETGTEHAPTDDGGVPPATTSSPATRVDRRSYLKLVGASAVATAGVASAATIDLGERGLDEGDLIDPYFEEYVRSGNTVYVPGGTYQFDGGGLHGNYSGTTKLIGRGEVVLDHGDGEVVDFNFKADGGTLVWKNFTFRGTAEKGRIRLESLQSGDTTLVENVNRPDGAYDGGAIGFFVGKYHSGTLTLRDCHVQGFPNNGLYASAVGKVGDGAVEVEGGLYKNNNIANVRIGSDGTYVRGTNIVVDELEAVHPNGANMRGLRVRQPADGMLIEDVDVTYTHTGDGATYGIGMERGSAGSTNCEIRNCRVRQEAGEAIRYNVDASEWAGDDVDLTGSADLTYPSHWTNVCVGDGCETPGDGSPDGDLLEIVAADGVEFDYEFTVDGSVDPATDNGDNSAEPDDNDSITDNGDGTKTASGATGNGYGDAYRFSADVTDWNATADESNVDLSVDGRSVTVDDLLSGRY